MISSALYCCNDLQSLGVLCGINVNMVSPAIASSDLLQCVLIYFNLAVSGDTGVSQAVCGVGRVHEAAAQTQEEASNAVPGRLRGAATQLQATPAHRQCACCGSQPQPHHR